MKTKLIIGTFTASLVLAWIGFVCYGSFLSALLPRVDNVGYSPPPGGYMGSLLWFALLCGLLPVIIVLTWITTNTKDYQGRLLSIGLVSAGIFVALAIRYYMVWEEVDTVSQIAKSLKASEGIEHEVNLNASGFKYLHYLFVGEMTGFLFAFVVLKNRQKRRDVEPDILDATP